MTKKSEADRGFLLLARASKWLGITLTFTVPILVIGNIQCAESGVGAWVVVGAAALVGSLAADVVSGMVHWAGDRWGTEKTFMLGPPIVKPFDRFDGITTGWMNPLLRRVRFFERLEARIERATGVPPYREPDSLATAPT